MPSLPLTMLNEYYINYIRIESPIFRVGKQLKKINSYKVASFPKLRKFLKRKNAPLVYSLIYEEFEDENGKIMPTYILNAYIDTITPDPDMPFITDKDTKFAILSYVVNDNEDDVAIESVAVGNTSVKLAISSVTEAYKNHKDFKLIRGIDSLVFKKIISY